MERREGRLHVGLLLLVVAVLPLADLGGLRHGVVGLGDVLLELRDLAREDGDGPLEREDLSSRLASVCKSCTAKLLMNSNSSPNFDELMNLFIKN